MKTAYVLLILALATASNSQTQPPSSDSWWITTGYGIARTAPKANEQDTDAWHHSRLSLSIDLSPQLFGTFATHVSRHAAFGGPFFGWEEAGVRTKIKTIALLIGKRAKAPRVGFVSAAAGLSYVEAIGNWPWRKGVGLPIELHAAITPGGYFGFGIEAFADLNSARTESALVFNVILGNVL